MFFVIMLPRQSTQRSEVLVMIFIRSQGLPGVKYRHMTAHNEMMVFEVLFRD